MTSIIVVTWNNLKYLKLAIQSIKKHTRNYELIVVDNGSTDGTKEYLSSLKKIKVIRNKTNKGWCKALNQGLKIAKGKYILFANDDIVVYKGWLKKMIAHFRPDVGAVGPTSNYVMGRQNIRWNDGRDETEQNFLIGFFLLVRADVMKKVGKIDERFGLGGSDDIDLSIRIRKAGYRLVIARDVYVHHFGSKSIDRLVGGGLGTQEYKDFIDKKDGILRKKWGDKIVDETMRQFIDVAFGVPILESVDPKFFMNFYEIRKPKSHILITSYRTLIPLARNMIAKQALKANAQYLLFLDDDMLFPSDIFFRLASHKKDIVSGLAKRRIEPHTYTAFKNGKPIKPNQGLKEVDRVGMFGILIKTEVFKKVKYPWFEANSDGGGEDINFCDKARKVGYKIYVDTNLIIPHLGEKQIIK